MDHSGKNRYELLFMDDDVCDPLDNVVAKSKKQAKTAASSSGVGAAGTTSKAVKQGINGNLKTQTNNNKKVGAAEKDNSKQTGAFKANDQINKKTGNANAGIDKTNKSGSGGTFGGANNVNQQRNKQRSVGAAGAEREGNGNQFGARSANNRQQQNGEQQREQRNNRRNVKENGYTPAEGSSQQATRQFRDNNRAPIRNRNNEAGNRIGKREFDRQSGSDRTGVKSIDKRDGAGAHNWGSVKEAIDDVKIISEGGATAEKTEDSGNEQAEAVPVEEETKEITLDEWKAQKQQRAKPTYNIRKAGEGEDTTQWKKMIVLTNNKKEKHESEEELEFDPAMYPQRVGRQQRVLDIQFNFNDGRRGGGGGGGGGGFGGRGRGRGPRPGGGGGGGVGGSGVAAGAGGGVGIGAAANANVNANVGGGTYGERAARAGFEGNRAFEGGAGGGRVGKRYSGNDRQQTNAAPKVNDELQFPTLS